MWCRQLACSDGQLSVVGIWQCLLHHSLDASKTAADSADAVAGAVVCFSGEASQCALGSFSVERRRQMVDRLSRTATVRWCRGNTCTEGERTSQTLIKLKGAKLRLTLYDGVLYNTAPNGSI